MTAEGSQRNDGKTLTHKDLEFHVEDQQTQDSWTFFFWKLSNYFSNEKTFGGLVFSDPWLVIMFVKSFSCIQKDWAIKDIEIHACKCITSILFFKAYTNDLELVQIFMGRISLNTLHSIWMLVIIYLRLIKVFEKRCDT